MTNLFNALVFWTKFSIGLGVALFVGILTYRSWSSFWIVRDAATTSYCLVVLSAAVFLALNNVILMFMLASGVKAILRTKWCTKIWKPIYILFWVPVNNAVGLGYFVRMIFFYCLSVVAGSLVVPGVFLLMGVPIDGYNNGPSSASFLALALSIGGGVVFWQTLKRLAQD